MGFYSDARDDFFQIYGYYPKNDVLKDFIDDKVGFYLQEKNKFVNTESNKDFIGYLRKKFYERYKFEPNDYDLFSYKLFRKEKNYIPSKIYLLLLMLFKDYHLTFSKLIGDSYYDNFNSYGYQYYEFVTKVLTSKPSKWESKNRICKFLYFTFISEDNIYRLLSNLIDDGIISVEGNLQEFIKNTIDRVNFLYNSEKYIYDDEINKLSTTGKEIKLEFLALFEKISNSDKFKNELITSFQTGNYSNNVIWWLFDEYNNGSYINAKCEVFKFIFEKLNVSTIHLPATKDFTELEFCYKYDLNKKISVIINSNYERYCLDGNLVFILESEEHYDANLKTIMNTNLFIDRINNFINKYHFKPTVEQFLKYVKNENEFDILFKELECFMKTGKLINKDSILGFFKTEPEKYLYYNSWNSPKNEWFSYSELGSLNNIISVVCDDVLYIPPRESWNNIYLEMNLSTLKKIVVSKYFNKFIERLYLGILDKSTAKLHIEEPYVTGEKVRALLGTRYYEEYRNEFLLTHTEAEWKYLVAPECVKETLKVSPNANCHVIEAYNDYGNNGISKIWWTDHYEAYEWDEQLHYWNYVYEHDHGSD